MKPSTPDPDQVVSVNAAWALLYTMSALSVKYFGSPWASGLETRLWESERVNKEERSTLIWLVRQSGCWWSWQNPENEGPSPVPIETWQEHMGTTA